MIRYRLFIFYQLFYLRIMNNFSLIFQSKCIPKFNFLFNFSVHSLAQNYVYSVCCFDCHWGRYFYVFPDINKSYLAWESLMLFASLYLENKFPKRNIPTNIESIYRHGFHISCMWLNEELLVD